MVRDLVVRDHVAGIAAESGIDAVNHLARVELALQSLASKPDSAAKLLIFAEVYRAAIARCCAAGATDSS